MLSKELLSKIREIKIKTRKLLSANLIGDFSTLKKGSGFDFNQLREYQEGDDIKFIDWKSSARSNKLIVKEYLQESNRTIWLVLDRSISTWYGSKNMLKYNVLAEASAILALMGQYSKDSVGVINLGESKEYIIPPKTGHIHTTRLMRYFLEESPKGSSTDFGKTFLTLSKLARKKSIIIVLSDFIGFKSIDMQQLSNLKNRHEVFAIRCLDFLEKKLPEAIIIEAEDPETGTRLLLNSNQMNIFLEKFRTSQEKLFKQFGVKWLDISPEKTFLEDLIKFFIRHSIN